MGAKAWFIAYYDEDPRATLANWPAVDADLSLLLARDLFPGIELEEIDDGNLDSLNPEENELFVGCYPGLKIAAHPDLGIDNPSMVRKRWLNPDYGRNAYLHATHSVVDWFAYALWKGGKLERSLSISFDNGIQEQIGEPLAFERPFWEGKHPAFEGDEDMEEVEEGEAYPLAFNPLDLSEASLLHHLGFQFEGRPADWVCDPSEIAIKRYKFARKRPFWKIW